MTKFTVAPSQLSEALERSIQSGVVPYVVGPPGIGKSDIFRNFAKKYNLKFIDIRLAQADPTDLNGFPMRSADGTKAEYVPFNVFPIEGDPLPEGYEGWLILLDEISSASKTVQAAAYKIILDRYVGTHKLHHRVVIAAAGNRMIDKAVVIPQSTALQSRMVHYELEVSKDDWIKWAHNHGVDSRIIGFIEYKPSYLHKFDPNHQERTFACPRTWAFVNQLIKGRKSLDHIDLVNMAGAISDGPAVEFKTFADIGDKVPSFESIVADPIEAKVPSEASFRYFVVSSLQEKTTADNIDKVAAYVDRFSEEFQVLYLRGIAMRFPNLRDHPEFSKRGLKLMRFASS